MARAPSVVGHARTWRGTHYARSSSPARREHGDRPHDASPDVRKTAVATRGMNPNKASQHVRTCVLCVGRVGFVFFFSSLGVGGGGKGKRNEDKT